ncbi:hypothetical protein Bca4012_007304 [Brassica carinata]
METLASVIIPRKNHSPKTLTATKENKKEYPYKYTTQRSPRPNPIQAMTEFHMEVESSKPVIELQVEEAETNSSSQESLPEPQVMYRCRKCRRIVAIEDNIVPHKPGKG